MQAEEVMNMKTGSEKVVFKYKLWVVPLFNLQRVHSVKNKQETS